MTKEKPPKLYFVKSGESEIGPLSSSQLIHLAKSGKITLETQIRSSSGTGGKWRSARSVNGLREIVESKPDNAKEQSATTNSSPNPSTKKTTVNEVGKSVTDDDRNSSKLQKRSAFKLVGRDARNLKSKILGGILVIFCMVGLLLPAVFKAVSDHKNKASLNSLSNGNDWINATDEMKSEFVESVRPHATSMEDVMNRVGDEVIVSRMDEYYRDQKHLNELCEDAVVFWDKKMYKSAKAAIELYELQQAIEKIKNEE